MLVGALLATKLLDDKRHSNAFWARVGGISLQVGGAGRGVVWSVVGGLGSETSAWALAHGMCGPRHSVFGRQN